MSWAAYSIDKWTMLESEAEMPSFTLDPSGYDRSTMSLHFPVFWGFGMTQNDCT